MKRIVNATLGTLALLALVACGGGGSGAANVADGTVAGTVAIGAALPSVTVTLIDANGTTKTATTDANGGYSMATTDLVKPFTLSVNVLLGDKQLKLQSVALDSGTRSNITPLTTAITGLMNASNNYDPASLQVSSITEASIATANSKLKAALSNVMDAAGVSASVNPITDSFQPNGTGIDSVLDRVSVNWSSSGIGISNKFVPITDSASLTTQTVTLTANTVPTPLPAGITPPDPTAVEKITSGLQKCLKLPVSQRISFTTTKAGLKIYTPSSIHADCSLNVANDYLFNGVEYAQRWLGVFSSEDFDSTSKVLISPVYVVDTSNNTTPWPGDKHVYVYNIYVYDKNGNIYTYPEMFAKVNGDLFFRGTQRKLEVSIQPQLTKVLDENGSSNFVEGRLLLRVNPFLVPDAGGGLAKFNYTGTASSVQTNVNGDHINGNPLPKAMCSWVTGPLLQNGVNHDISAPKGGVLVVPPHSALSARRDYGAIRIKYPATFDPINVANDRERLLRDCKTTHTAVTAEVGSASTNNAFTIDGVKLDANSSYDPRGYDNLADQYPTSSTTRTSCPAKTAPAGTSVSGWCYPDKRQNYVSDSEKTSFLTAYPDPKDIRFTFYTFVDNTYSDSTPGTAFASYNPENAANVSAFLSSAMIEHTRMVGAFPFVTKSGGVYSGADLFRSISPGTFLQAGAATVTAGTSVTLNWSIPAGADGVDRVGIGGWFNSNSGRIGVATYSDSWPVNKGTLTQSNTLGEDWYGYDWASYRSTTFTNAVASLAVSGYREIWVRGYDKDNRQIQTVVRATRN